MEQETNKINNKHKKVPEPDTNMKPRKRGREGRVPTSSVLDRWIAPRMQS